MKKNFIIKIKYKKETYYYKLIIPRKEKRTEKTTHVAPKSYSIQVGNKGS